MTIDEMIKVMEAYRNGVGIQLKEKYPKALQDITGEPKWEDASNLAWNFHSYEYRIKPETGKELLIRDFTRHLKSAGVDAEEGRYEDAFIKLHGLIAAQLGIVKGSAYDDWL